MNAIFEKSRPQGEICAPSSKSCAHRMLIGAALADGESVLHGISYNEDILATMDCLCAMGAEFAESANAICVRRRQRREKFPNFPCRESGSTLRFLIPLALLSGGGTFSGTERLLNRGVGIYEDLLRGDAEFQRINANTLRVTGALRAGTYDVCGNVSSQFISGLLFALPMLSENSVLRVLPPFESRGYVDLTMDALRSFGIQIQRQGDCFFVPGNQSYVSQEATVEGDWSQAAFFCAMNALGGSIRLNGLNANSLQGDRICESLLARIQSGFCEADISDCPDLAPVLFAAAAACGHGARFTGTKRLTIKESNRATVMAEELIKFSVRLIVEENAVNVLPDALYAPREALWGHNDHRIVMALSVLAAFTGGIIQGSEAVRKSYPNFFDDLHKIHVNVRCE